MKAVSRFLFGAAALAFATASAGAQDGGMQKWIKGKGWGWVWGPQDGVGNLNEMTDATGLAALKLVTQGKTSTISASRMIATHTSGRATAQAKT